VARRKLGNVVVVRAKSGDEFAHACCDSIFLRTYHHLTKRGVRCQPGALAEPGGRLAIIDFPRGGLDPGGRIPSTGGPRYPQKIVVEELSAAGLASGEKRE